MTRYSRLPNGHTIAERFMIQAVLGHGRTSTVYRALDRQTRSHVALKVLDPFLAQDETGLARFAREVEIIRSLDHPNIVKVYDFLRDGDLWVICMECVAGLDAKAHMTRCGALSVTEFLVVARQMLSALEACHRRRILHRDLKPQNLLMTAGGAVKLVDFGISRVNTMSDLTKTGTVLGTPDYMAPELFRSTRADTRSDIYSAGAVFYELLTGRPPHSAGSLSAAMVRTLAGEIEPITALRPHVPRWLEAVVMKCLRVDPGARYQTCFELLRDVERGERALAAYDEARPRALCLRCKGEIVRGLPFCQLCGTFSHESYQGGAESVVLGACDDVDGLTAHLARLSPGSSARELKARIARLPVVVVRGVSADTAAALSNELARFPCELRTMRSLPTGFWLPGAHLALAPLLLLPIVWCDTVLGRLGVTLGAELVLLALFRRQVRPLIRRRDVKTASTHALDATVRRIAGGMRELTDANLKTILGNIVSGLLRAREREGATAAVFPATALVGVVMRGLEAARIAEGYEVFLSSASRNDIRARLESVKRRIEDARDAESIASLIDAKEGLARELAEYHHIEEAQSRLHLALLHLQGIMKRIEQADDDDVCADSLVGEIGLVEEDFAVQYPAIRASA